MNEKQAIAKLRKVIGQGIAWQYSRGALNAAGRDSEREKARALRTEEHALKEQLDALRAKLLADPEYVALRKRWSDTKDSADRASSLSYSKPIKVGRNGAMFFTVLADGDTWDEIVTKLLPSSNTGEKT
jgi:hypothetical protein